MKIWQLFSDRSKWTRGAWARDSKNNSTYVEDPRATCFCLSAAIRICYPEGERYTIGERIRKKVKMSPMLFNDSHSYEEVLALCKELDI